VIGNGRRMADGPWRTVRRVPLPHRGRASSLVVGSVLGLVLVVVAIGVDGWASTAKGFSTEGDGPTRIGSVGVGARAPEFVAVAIDGSPVRLSDLQGQGVWLTFNDSRCQACRAENPDIEVAFEAARPLGVVVLAIFVSEDDDTVTDYARRAGLHFASVADPDRSIGDLYRVAATPTHYFIDRSGVVRAIVVGGLDPAAMDAAWRALL
jgi:cytochrome c biogenesis protein CcmG, thiol:disulfide interchange protein DsbE